MKKYHRKLSLITNFGCSHKCWYCIWNSHPLKHINLETDWNKFEKLASRYCEYNNVISVSGGGDCLYKYNQNKDWWNQLFQIAEKLKIKINVHSRTKIEDEEFLSKINKYVFSSDDLDKDISYLNYLIHTVPIRVRIVHVVTADTTDVIAQKYIDFCFKHMVHCQLTFKELVGFSDNGRYKELKSKYLGKYNTIFLNTGDYNIYFMPNNKIYSHFNLIK